MKPSLNLLYGLNEAVEDIHDWVCDMKALHNTSMLSGLAALQPIPLVLHKELVVGAAVHTGEIFVTMQRNKDGDPVTGVRMSLEDYRAFQGFFDKIKHIIEAVQEGGDVKPLLEGAKVEKDYYGWLFARMEMSGDIKLTVLWNSGKRQTLVKLHRGRVSPQDGIWYPLKKTEICLGAGGMLYLMKYAAPKAEKLISWWEVALDAAVSELEDCRFEDGDQQSQDYEDEMQKAVASLSTDPEWAC